MFFHRDDAVAHRLSLSGDRPLAKIEVTSSYWASTPEEAVLMSGARNRSEKRWIGQRLGGVLRGSPLPYRCHRTPLTHSPERLSWLPKQIKTFKIDCNFKGRTSEPLRQRPDKPEPLFALCRYTDRWCGVFDRQTFCRSVPGRRLQVFSCVLKGSHGSVPG